MSSKLKSSKLATEFLDLAEISLKKARSNKDVNVSIMLSLNENDFIKTMKAWDVIRIFGEKRNINIQIEGKDVDIKTADILVIKN